MAGQDQNLFLYLLDLSEANAIALHAELSIALFAEHERRRRTQRTDPPSEAQFAAEIGLKPNTYSKARRRTDLGATPRWSRKSLATISLCQSLPRSVTRSAGVLLWHDILHRQIAAQGIDVRRAIAARDLFDLPENVQLDTCTTGRVAASASVDPTGGASVS